MADKPVINTIASTSRYSTSQLNTIFDQLASAFEGVWGLGGVNESTNTVTGNLDMQLKKITNLGAPTATTDAARLQDISDAADLDSGLITLRTELASTANGEGASLIGIEDADGDYTSTTVEGALGEIGDHIADTSTHGVTGDIVGTTDTQTLHNKTLGAPTISTFENATHDHTNAANGGVLAAAVSPGLLTITLANNSIDSVNDLDFSAGKAVDSTDSQSMTLSSTVVKRIDANWSAGTGNGGFPSGLTLSDGTWYHCFVISKADGTTDAGWDTSTSATNLLADATGYTLYRRVGSIYYIDSTDGIRDFVQRGDKFTWGVIQTDAADKPNASTSVANTSISVPSLEGITATGYFSAHDNNATGVMFYILLSSPLQADTAPTSTKHSYVQYMAVGDNTHDSSVRFEIPTDNSIIRVRVSNAGAITYNINTEGYIDLRGRT